MMGAHATRSSFVRGIGIAAFAAVVGGLPIAVELSGPVDRLAGNASIARADGVIPIFEPVRVSDRLPLTIDSGIVAVVEQSRAEDGRGPSVIAIDDAVLTLDLAERGAIPATTGAIAEGKAAGIAQIAGFSSGAVQLRRARLRAVTPDGMQIDLNDVAATITVTRKGSYKLIGSGQLNGMRAAVEAIWSDPGVKEATSAIPLRIVVKSPAIEATFDGAFSADDEQSFTGQADIRLPNLKSFIPLAGLGRGVGEHMRSIAVTGPVAWTTERMAFTRATVAVNDHQATGVLTVKRAGGRISIDGTLGFDDLDLGRKLPALPTSAATKAGPHVLTMIDADLRLSANKILSPALEMGRAAVSLSLSKGRLQAEIAELEVEGGAAVGQFSVDLNEPSPRASIKAKLKGIDIGRMLAEPLRRNAILGRANIAFDGTFGGPPLGDGLASLAGRGQFDLAEPGRLGLDVPALVHAAKGSNVVGWSAAGRGGTAIDALTGRFRVLNGALTIETMQARSGGAVLMGSGRLDVPARLMDMSVTSAPSAGGDASASAPDVLLLRGTWDAPAISLLRKPAMKVEAPIVGAN